MQIRSIKVPAAILGVFLLLSGQTACTPTPQTAPVTPQNTATAGSVSPPSGESLAVTRTASPTAATTEAATEVAAMLQYLIEEEKLAHDVYQQFAQMWDGGIFENIRDSEVRHQQELLVVLKAKGIPDPRTDQPGTFKDQRVQQMYDQFTRQGASSVLDAYKAGAAIEEQDIADLTAYLKSTSDPLIVPVLERLRAGSQNHLQAFQAHLD